MLIILSTHPIQYQVPVWQRLAEDKNVNFEVWYLTDHGTRSSHDVQFAKSFSWDIDLLKGYKYRFLKVNSDAAPNRGFYNVRLQESLSKLLKEKKAQFLLVNGWQVLAYWQAVWHAHRAGVEVWLRAETNDLKPATWKEGIRRLLLGQFFKRVNYFLYIGQANRRFYKGFGVPDNQLLPGLYCVDNDQFEHKANALRMQRESIRKEWNIPSDATCFAFVGKLIEKKRPLDLVAAVRNWQGRPVHLLFIGSGELQSQVKVSCNLFFDEGKTCKSVTNDLPAASFVGFLNQSEIAKAYVAADAIVLPSNFGETWGLVVNEAMASGTPAIVSDSVGCAEDLVKPINPSLIFRFGDTGSLRLALKYFQNLQVNLSTIKEVIDNHHLDVTVNSIKLLFTKSS